MFAFSSRSIWLKNSSTEDMLYNAVAIAVVEIVLQGGGGKKAFYFLFFSLAYKFFFPLPFLF